ncbi:MAG: GDSL-type esterase/lipase family protein [Deltaproteobacteria bacterium]|nr:GDSL-type esterase/lipase family protein [Deltaproteobacteria bacterium]
MLEPTHKTTRMIHLLAMLGFLAFLVGCDGSGGDGENLLPTADAGADQVVDEQTLVMLHGIGTDTDGSIVSVAWIQSNGPLTTLNGADTYNATFTAPVVTQEMTLTFRLTVIDNEGLTASDDVIITINPVNEAPTADAGQDQFVIVTPGEQTLVTLIGGGTDLEDGSNLSYVWIQTDGPDVTFNDSGTGNAIFAAPSISGLLKFQLTVTDTEGANDNDEVTVSVAKSIFSDDFEDGNADNWESEDDSGIFAGWTVISREYQQQNLVETKPGGYEDSYHLGTYSYPDIGSNWDNYRFSVELTPLKDFNLPEDNQNGNDVGIMFRYQDAGTYYRLSMSSRYGFTRFEKRFNGTFSTLAVDSVGYYDGETLYITIEVNGSVIQVYVNDDPLFSVSDPDPITSGTIALYCQDKAKFDNVLVTENSLSPSVIISEPVACSIATTDTDSLDVSAIATNVPEGGWVEFVLDDTETIVSDFINDSHCAQFTSVSQGEHKLAVVLRDGTGSELATDTNEKIGVLGDYYVAVGDSLTNGFRDNYAADNTSLDGRIIAMQGFEANLNNLLTTTVSVPHIVFNEGIGGEKSGDMIDTLDGRIYSILERHPCSNKALILLGINDSNNGDNPVNTVDYQNNMQALVDAVHNAGKEEAWVAFVPPYFNADGTPNTDRNEIIREYNSAILDLSGIELGPDFYTYFENRSSLFADSAHPNGLGYAVMASLWNNSLTGHSTFPFIVENLDPLEYKQNLLEEGDKYYIDENYALTDIPAEVESGVWIMTANADGISTDFDFLSFNIDRNVSVYVAYDGNASMLPDWLSTFADTGLQVGTTNGSLNLYNRDYASGPISLGGNMAGGGTGTSNYIIIVVEK